MGNPIRTIQNENATNKLTHLCSDFFPSFSNDASSFPFCNYCQLVTYYLKHIKTNEHIYVKACCKFFFYKLWGLMKKYQCMKHMINYMNSKYTNIRSILNMKNLGMG
ncbi:variable surface protein [Plasmodium gonderi]|uniref:Variable surface protein n=1 Tax=Plasmodium gonderi TaxID=77519 RepID=A0A1Y1JTE8_PLAGO|nr:variable surface protein [Plasmodium gonderi]GAW84042.1 variable surface protein [Plasmodium gonderi]